MKKRFDALAGIGFVYNTKIIRVNGDVEEETTHNLIPMEGLLDILSVWLKTGAQAAGWYVAQFEGNYTPDSTLTAANFAAVATECTAYTQSTRVQWIGGTPAAGAVNNSASPAIFTMNAVKTIYGGGLLSSSTKGGVTGKIGSAVRYASPKVLAVGDQLSVIAGISLISA